MPLPVFAALPAAVLVGYIGANEPKILARTAVRNLGLRRLLEQCLATGQALDGIVDAYRINWVWMPPWGPEKITEDGREQMRAIGFSI